MIHVIKQICMYIYSVPCVIWEIFSEFEIATKYEKRGKYLAILHEATCDNYFIAKCLLKSNESRVTLHRPTNCIGRA